MNWTNWHCFLKIKKIAYLFEMIDDECAKGNSAFHLLLCFLRRQRWCATSFGRWWCWTVCFVRVLLFHIETNELGIFVANVDIEDALFGCNFGCDGSFWCCTHGRINFGWSFFRRSFTTTNHGCIGFIGQTVETCSFFKVVAWCFATCLQKVKRKNRSDSTMMKFQGIADICFFIAKNPGENWYFHCFIAVQ